MKNIYSPPGTKIRYDQPDNGYVSDQKLCQEKLKLNHIYTIKKIDVHPYSSDLYLREVNGCFNTALFTEINSIADIISLLETSFYPGVCDICHSIDQECLHFKNYKICLDCLDRLLNKIKKDLKENK